MAVGKDAGEPGTASRRGRPRQSARISRSKRVVTFVTSAELEALRDLAAREGRSLSSVVQRVIRLYLKQSDDDVN